ncbi:MAG: hypothetical protein LBP70_03360 [Mycoplasmataceae bacterium]|nr:hypothetical protein [Mycoplasmataceae bacterium]
MKDTLKHANFQTIIEKQLNILAYLEKINKSKKNESAELLTTYNQLSGKNFTIDKNVSFIDNEALVDDINYLNVYIHNIYKIDIEALAAGKDAKISQPTVSEVAPVAASSGFPFAAGAAMNNLPPNQNPINLTTANLRIHQEAMQGKVYLFKTKPKYMPLLKWIASALLLLFSMSMIFIGVGLICSKNSIHANNISVGDHVLSDYLDFLTALPYFFIALANGFMCYQTIAPLLKKNNNENRVYAFVWRYYLLIIILFCMLLIFGGATGVHLYIYKSSMLPWTAPAESSTHAFGLWAWFLGYTLTFIFLGLLIAIIIIGAINAPKIDTERLNALMKQYVEENVQPPPQTTQSG